MVMIQGTQVRYIDLEKTVDTDTPLHFSSFLFYINSWDWDNLPTQTNFELVPGAQSNILNLELNFAESPEDVIDSINSRKETTGSTPSLFESSSRERLYFIAATCKRYLIESVVRKESSDTPLTSFDKTEYIPQKDTSSRWSVWSGDIQAYTPNDSGILYEGSKVYAKNLTIQDNSPVSVKNNYNTYLDPGGFGEVFEENYITNYVNEEEIIQPFECVPLVDGWYGVVTISSTPHYIEGGLGIDFDTFIRIENNTVAEFHPLYPGDYSNNLSDYGKNYSDFINK